MTADLRKAAIPSLLALALLVCASALPSLAFADDTAASSSASSASAEKSGEASPVETASTSELGEIKASVEQYRDVVNSQVVGDLYFIATCSAVLLALDLGALCWLCFRVR